MRLGAIKSKVSSIARNASSSTIIPLLKVEYRGLARFMKTRCLL